MAAWAQGSQDFGSNVPAWAQLSAVAVLVILLVIALRVAYTFATGAYAREIERGDAAVAALDRMTHDLIEKYGPALTASQQVMLDAATEVRLAREELRSLRDRR